VAGSVNTAVALMVGLAGGPEAARLADELGLMDLRASKRGYLLEAERWRREAIIAQAVRTLGFDPRTQAGPRRPVPQPAPAPAQRAQDAQPVMAALAVDLAPKPLQLTAGVGAEPLQGGDWRGLWERVQAGQITEEEARGFGQAWKAAGL